MVRHRDAPGDVIEPAQDGRQDPLVPRQVPLQLDADVGDVGVHRPSGREFDPFPLARGVDELDAVGTDL